MGNKAGIAPAPVSPEDELIPLGGEVTVASFARRLAAVKEESVVVICGAGISVSAGIPDFRTKGSGLYDNLQKYDLPTPESIFTLSYFKEHPMPFFQLAKEIYPGKYAPTPTHAFIRLLQEKGLLLRCYTQNIDTLERLAGVHPKRLVEAHGSFSQAHCLDCKAAHSSEWVREEVMEGRVPVRCPTCGGLVKPDIVFFGEGLPKRFSMLHKADLPEAELLIVMGTSLSVEPFASLVNQVSPLCARLLINKVPVGLREGRSEYGFRFGAYDNYRDVALLAPCDVAAQALAAAVGWGDSLEELVKAQQLEQRQALVRAQLEALAKGGGTQVMQVSGPDPLPEDAFTRPWRRRFAPEIPPLMLLNGEEDPPQIYREPPAMDATPPALPAAQGEGAEGEGEGAVSDGPAPPDAPGEEAPEAPQPEVPAEEAEAVPPSPSVRIVRSSGSGAEGKLEGGSTLELRLLLASDAPPLSGSPWLGLVLAGLSRPDKVVDKAACLDEDGKQRAAVLLTVPALKKRQLERGDEKSYEVWLVRERTRDDGEVEDVALARAGPITVAGNVEGVGIANRFARLATFAVYSDEMSGGGKPDEAVDAGVAEGADGQ